MQDLLYREELLEHYRNPLNFGRLSSFDKSSKQVNPFCGDEIEIFIKWEERDRGDRGDKTIKDIGFIGKGCAISIASASMFTDFAKGKSKTQLTKFSQIDMLNLLEIEVSETRKKCALLAWSVLKDCLR